jgi:hypothetical protein
MHHPRGAFDGRLALRSGIIRKAAIGMPMDGRDKKEPGHDGHKEGAPSGTDAPPKLTTRPFFCIAVR